MNDSYREQRMKKIDTVHPDRFEFGMTTNTNPRLVVLKIIGVKGQEVSVPLEHGEAVKLGISIAGFAHAVRRAEAHGDRGFDRDLDDLSDLLS